MRIALIKNEVVKNIIEAELEFANSLGYDLVKESNIANIGDSFIGGVFVPPPVQPSVLIPPIEKPRHITQYAFLSRFTPEERITIRTAAKTVIEIEDYMDMLSKAKYIDLDNLVTIAGLTALETAGLIVVGRAAEIATTDVVDGERP